MIGRRTVSLAGGLLALLGLVAVVSRLPFGLTTVVNALPGPVFGALGCVRTGNAAGVEFFLDRGVAVDSRDPVGKGTLLIHAARTGHVSVVRLLLDRAADVEAETTSGNTALLLAAEFGHKDSVRLLLDRGADPNHANRRGRTPLDGALKQGHTQVASLLRAAGAGRKGSDRFRAAPSNNQSTLRTSRLHAPRATSGPKDP